MGEFKTGAGETISEPQDKPEMKTGTGEGFEERSPDDTEMVTGDGQVVSGPNRGQSSGSSPADDGDDEPTKAELMDKAKKKDISGRSSMNKEELARAIDEA